MGERKKRVGKYLTVISAVTAAQELLVQVEMYPLRGDAPRAVRTELRQRVVVVVNAGHGDRFPAMRQVLETQK